MNLILNIVLNIPCELGGGGGGGGDYGYTG